jgi:hypothetical protein
MNISKTEPKNVAVFDCGTGARKPAIGLVCQAEFAAAQGAIADLTGYCDYEDWLDTRQGFQMGLAMAGVDVTPVFVGLSSFLKWCALTGIESTERALDEFAGVAMAARSSSGLRVFGEFREIDFARGVPGDTFADDGDSREQVHARRATRADAAFAGSQVQTLPVRRDGFVDWCICIGLRPSAAALDRYAQLLLEELTDDLAN